jgi:hypothetical protein
MELSESQHRPLVRQLSRAAVVLDVALHGKPVLQASNVDYEQRVKKQQQRAVKELEQLKNALAELPL